MLLDWGHVGSKRAAPPQVSPPSSLRRAALNPIARRLSADDREPFVAARGHEEGRRSAICMILASGGAPRCQAIESSRCEERSARAQDSGSHLPCGVAEPGPTWLSREEEARTARDMSTAILQGSFLFGEWNVRCDEASRLSPGEPGCGGVQVGVRMSPQIHRVSRAGFPVM